jgi:hypothetical protein
VAVSVSGRKSAIETITWLFDVLHLWVTVAISERLVQFAGAQGVWLLVTWALPTYILPSGVGLSLRLLHRNSNLAPYKVAVALLALSVSIVTASLLLRQLLPAWISIIRPSLILTPVLWVIVGIFCWRWREAARRPPSATLANASRPKTKSKD